MAKRCWFGRQKRRPPEKAERIQDDHASAIMLISILTVIVLLLLFVIYPLVKILLFSLTDASGTFSLATAAEIFPPPGI